MTDLEQRLTAHIARKYGAGTAPALADSLFYSGLIDSLGIQEIAQFLRDATGRDLSAAEIVEGDLDTIELLARWAGGVSG